jgi:secretory phospholipase A2
MRRILFVAIALAVIVHVYSRSKVNWFGEDLFNKGKQFVSQKVKQVETGFKQGKTFVQEKVKKITREVDLGGQCKCDVNAQRPTGQVSSINGCGSGKLMLPAFFTQFMRPCCNEHDLCYDICGVSKKKCDIDLESCMVQQCNNRLMSVERLACVQAVRTGMKVVNSVCFAFVGAQQRMCGVC